MVHSPHEGRSVTAGNWASLSIISFWYSREQYVCNASEVVSMTSIYTLLHCCLAISETNMRTVERKIRIVEKIRTAVICVTKRPFKFNGETYCEIPKLPIENKSSTHKEKMTHQNEARDPLDSNLILGNCSPNCMLPSHCRRLSSTRIRVCVVYCVYRMQYAR